MVLCTKKLFRVQIVDQIINFDEHVKTLCHKDNTKSTRHCYSLYESSEKRNYW